jgi:UPF0755 protein
MSTLDQRIRDHVDALARPIELHEIDTRSRTDESPRRSRWPTAAAAAVLAVGGLTAVVFAVLDRESPSPDLAPAVTEPSTPATVPVTSPSVRSVEIVVPAGLTIEQIGEHLAASLDTIDAAEFARAAEQSAAQSVFRPDGVESPEGLLAPGTYEVSEAESEADIADRMVAAMNNLGNDADFAVNGAALGRSPYEILIIASMIEQEAIVARDRASISRVIYNRLFVTEINPADPFPLQIDTTVRYGWNQLGRNPDAPLTEIRQVPSDWNTYLLPGLPATPISSPSRDSINAALEPSPNPGPDDPLCVELARPDECFLFFYVPGNEDGSKAFAATREQHQVNIDRAIELGLL